MVLRKHQRAYVSITINQYEQYFSLFNESFIRRGLASLDFRNWLEIFARYVSPANFLSTIFSQTLRKFDRGELCAKKNCSEDSN